MANITTTDVSVVRKEEARAKSALQRAAIYGDGVAVYGDGTGWLYISVKDTVNGQSFGSAEELFDYISSNFFLDGGGGGGGAVDSVNGKTGTVVLNASDVGAATTAELADKVSKAGDTMTKTLNVMDTTDQSKIVLGKYITGSGHNNAPTAFDKSSVYLHLGGVEYNTNSYRLIGFGYRRNVDQSHTAAAVGYQETNTSTDDCGRLLFATRPTPTDIAPTVRMTIEPNGEIQAKEGAKFVGDGSGITGVATAAQGVKADSALQASDTSMMPVADKIPVFSPQGLLSTGTPQFPENAVPLAYFDAELTNRVKSVQEAGVGTVVTNMISLTQAQYDGLAVKNPSTYYIING